MVSDQRVRLPPSYLQSMPGPRSESRGISMNYIDELFKEKKTLKEHPELDKGPYDTKKYKTRLQEVEAELSFLLR